MMTTQIFFVWIIFIVMYRCVPHLKIRHWRVMDAKGKCLLCTIVFILIARWPIPYQEMAICLSWNYCKYFINTHCAHTYCTQNTWMHIWLWPTPGGLKSMYAVTWLSLQTQLIGNHSGALQYIVDLHTWWDYYQILSCVDVLYMCMFVSALVLDFVSLNGIKHALMISVQYFLLSYTKRY